MPGSGVSADLDWAACYTGTMSRSLLQTIVLRTAIVLAVAYVLLNLGLAIRHNYRINTSIRALQDEIAQLEARILFLHNKIVYLSSTSYRHTEVKRRLGMKLTGETVVLVPSNVDESRSNGQTLGRPTLSVDQSGETALSWAEQASANASTWFSWLRGN